MQGRFDLITWSDGSVQLQLSTPNNTVDIIFENQEQFLRLVAGQHVENAKRLLAGRGAEEDADEAEHEALIRGGFMETDTRDGRFFGFPTAGEADAFQRWAGNRGYATSFVSSYKLYKVFCPRKA